MMRENMSIYLCLGAVHRMENPGRITLTVIKVQFGPVSARQGSSRFF
jgi:mannose-1-phosphate guanylyltransferase / mannose-6-phosphate isomerase